MHKSIKLFPLFWLSWSLAIAQAIEDPKPSAKKSFFESIKVRKAFESLDDRDEPAAVFYTKSTEKGTSYLINGGVSYNLTKAKHTDGFSVRRNVEAFFVMNKNTLIDEEQDNLKGGFTLNYMLGKLDDKSKTKQLLYVLLNNSFEYINDKRDTSHSAAVTSYFGLIHNKKNKGSLTLNAYRDIGKGGFQYFLQLNTGPEYQNTIAAKKEINEGWALRWYYGAEFRLGLKKKKGSLPATLGNRVVELIISDKGRFILADSFAATDYYLPLVKLELALYPTLSNDFSLSFSYNNGSDPIADLPNQEFYLLSVKFKK